MKIVVVVQARVASTRLPAKVLLDLGGRTALEQCLRRASRFERVSEVVIATSDQPADEMIAAVGRRLGYRVVRGSESDVLARYVRAAEETSADVIVRCTSDCPLLDPELSSLVIRRFLEVPGGADYAANVLERRLPRGLDTEVLSLDALMRAHRDASAPEEREHVTLHAYRRPEKFRCVSVLADLEQDWSHFRWTLDTLDDYRFLHAVFERLGARADSASLRDLLDLLAAAPELASINAHILQKSIPQPGTPVTNALPQTGAASIIKESP